MFLFTPGSHIASRAMQSNAEKFFCTVTDAAEKADFSPQVAFVLLNGKACAIS